MCTAVEVWGPRKRLRKLRPSRAADADGNDTVSQVHFEERPIRFEFARGQDGYIHFEVSWDASLVNAF